jgi:four helix bundle protein
MELETHILIALRLGYLDREQVDPLLTLSTDVGKMLTRLRAALSAREQSR